MAIATIDYFQELGFVHFDDDPMDVYRLPSDNKYVSLSIVRGLSIGNGMGTCVTLHGWVPSGKNGLRYVQQDIPGQFADVSTLKWVVEHVLKMSIEELKQVALQK